MHDDDDHFFIVDAGDGDNNYRDNIVEIYSKYPIPHFFVVSRSAVRAKTVYRTHFQPTSLRVQRFANICFEPGRTVRDHDFFARRLVEIPF